MIIVYTAILGSSDSLKTAPVGADRCFCFTDDPAHVADPKGWEVHLWPKEQWLERNSRREAWRLRALPHELFAGYDTVIWIDASFTITDLPRILSDAKGYEMSGLPHHKRASCYAEGIEVVRVGQADPVAVERQMKRYRRAGFAPAALTISCLLVRGNTPAVKQFNQAWNKETRENEGDNTQLSSDYAAWISGFSIHHLEGQWKANPYAVYDSADHKRRRKPYSK